MKCGGGKKRVWEHAVRKTIPPRRNWSEEDIKLVKKLYIEEGYTMKGVGDVFGVPPTTIESVLRRLRRPLTSNRGMYKHKYERDPIQIEVVNTVLELYLFQGYSPTEISNKTNLTTNSVSGIIYREKIRHNEKYNRNR